MAAGGKLEVEFRLRGGGKPHWLAASGHVFLGADGRPERIAGVLRDATSVKDAEAERERLERALAQAHEGARVFEERYRVLFEDNPNPMLIFDVQSLSILAANEAAQRYYGYTRQEMTGMTIDRLQTPESLPLLHRSSAMNEKYRRKIGRHRRKDGSVVDVEVTSHALRFEGRTARLVLVRDVTESLALQRRTTVQYATARILSESSTLDEALRRVNQAVCGILGWSAGLAWRLDLSSDTLRLANLWMRSPSQAERFEQLCRKISYARGSGLPGRVLKTGCALASGDVAKGPAWRRAPHAARQGFRSQLAVPIAGRDVAFGVLEYFSDEAVTVDEKVVELLETLGRQIGQFIERKRAEESLKREQAQRQEIFDIMPAMIWFKDTENRIVSCNKAAAESLDMTPQEMAGRSVYELYPEDGASYYQHDLDVIKTGKPKLGIIEQLPMAGGERRWVQTDKIPRRNEAGDITGVLVSSFDITERKKIEDVLRESERAQRDFVANVSHEFRTPVAAIRGFAETLRAGALEDRRNRLRFVRIIERHAERLGRLVEELLTISALDSGVARKRLAPIRLGPFVQDYARSIATIARHRKVKIKLDVPEGIVVVADELQLIQALENLVGNAIKYNRPGGWVQVGARVRGAAAHVTVADNGIGISPADLPRVFDRFFKVEKASSGNSGLGLNIVKKIVESHGGRIWAHSRLHKGSTFHFTLPLRR